MGMLGIISTRLVLEQSELLKKVPLSRWKTGSVKRLCSRRIKQR